MLPDAEEEAWGHPPWVPQQRTWAACHCQPRRNTAFPSTSTLSPDVYIGNVSRTMLCPCAAVHLLPMLVGFIAQGVAHETLVLRRIQAKHGF